MGLVKKTFLWLVTVLLAYSILLPILFIIFGINELFRAILRIFLYCSGSSFELISDGTESLYPTDAEWTGGLILGILASKDTDPNLDQERRHFQRSVLQKPGPNGINSPRMYEKLEQCLDSKWGYACRRRGEFNIENHVRLWTETSPTNGEFYTEHEYQTEILPKLSMHFDYSSKPGWEWVIIPKVRLDSSDTDLSTVRVFRIHHSYMDGISAGLLITECLMNFLPSSDHPPYSLNPKAKLSRDNANLVMLNQVRAFIVLPYYLMKGLLFSKEPVQDPIRPGPNNEIQHYGVSKNIRFSHIRDMRLKLASQKQRSLGTTNVFASIFTSALAQFLEENGRLTGTSELVLYATTAIFPYKDSRPRNQPLPSRIQIPLRKCSEMQLVDVTGSGKNSFPFRYFLLGLGRFQQKIFQWVIWKGISKYPTSTVITCVPGLKNKGNLNCGGDLVTDMGAWSIASKFYGLSVVVMSYGDHVKYWCVANNAVMSRAEFDRFLELLTLQK